jgi:4-hydroxy-2-oxoheptanedioate aldolase
MRGGALATMAKINLADPRVVEIAGLAGVDAVWLCNEHVPNDWLNLENMIRAARVHDVDALVRVGKGSYADYIRPFEAGAAGIIIPHVESEAEAKAIIQMTCFHPLGKRALDNGNVNGGFARVKVGEYIKFWSAEQLIIIQIESPEALAQVEAIAAVPGVSGLFFGPGDFAHRLGRAGDGGPEVVAARRQVARAAVAAGKFSVALNFGSREEIKAEGHQLVAVGADVGGLNQFFTAKLESYLSCDENGDSARLGIAVTAGSS